MISAQSPRGSPTPSPRVSIVIPTFNREELLARTIDSVLLQTTSSWELVIFDDGSTDGTAALGLRCASNDSRIRYLTGANGGVAMARNRGLAATDTRAPYIILLDHDDLLTPDALACLVEALDAHPAWIAAHGLARCVDDRDQQPPGDMLESWMRERQALVDNKLVRVRPEDPTSFSAVVVENWIVTPGTMMMRREALGRVGGFDPETSPADDWDLVVRLSRIGQIGFVDKVVLFWRRHEGALSASGNWRRAYFRVRDKIVTDPTNTPLQARVGRAAYRRANLGSWKTVWSAIRGRRYASAAGRLTRALYGEARYARAVVAALVHPALSSRHE